MAFFEILRFSYGFMMHWGYSSDMLFDWKCEVFVEWRQVGLVVGRGGKIYKDAKGAV